MPENGIWVRPSHVPTEIAIEVVYSNPNDQGKAMHLSRKRTFKLMWALFKASFRIKGNF
jgi:hypothetical protein